MNEDVGAGPRLRQLLGRLEDRWAREGAGIARALRPPATQEHLRRVEAELGVRLPVEVGTWFGWHDGVDVGTDLQTAPPFLCELVSLATALELRRAFLADTPRPEYTYRPTWLPFASSGPNSAFVVDCSGGPAAPAPVHVVDYSVNEPWDDVRAPSLTAAAELWWHLSEQGVYRWSPDDGDWEDNGLRIPPELRWTGIV